MSNKLDKDSTTYKLGYFIGTVAVSIAIGCILALMVAATVGLIDMIF